MANDEEWYESGRRGVVLSLVRREGGSVRMTLAHVAQSGAGQWRHETPINFRDFSADELVEMTLSEDTLADIGLTVMACLASQIKASSSSP